MHCHQLQPTVSLHGVMADKRGRTTYSSLPRTQPDWVAERAFAVAEETGAATRSALKNLRIPHDGGGHAPPTIPTGHGES